ncbi:hypothetical protein ScPMuIL_018184 [Solemya velum]
MVKVFASLILSLNFVLCVSVELIRKPRSNQHEETVTVWAPGFGPGRLEQELSRPGVVRYSDENYKYTAIKDSDLDACFITDLDPLWTLDYSERLAIKQSQIPQIVNSEDSLVKLKGKVGSLIGAMCHSQSIFWFTHFAIPPPKRKAISEHASSPGTDPVTPSPDVSALTERVQSSLIGGATTLPTVRHHTGNTKVNSIAYHLSTSTVFPGAPRTAVSSKDVSSKDVQKTPTMHHPPASKQGSRTAIHREPSTESRNLSRVTPRFFPARPTKGSSPENMLNNMGSAVSPPRPDRPKSIAGPFRTYRTPPRPRKATTQSRNSIPENPSDGIPNVVSPSRSASVGVSAKPFKTPPRPILKNTKPQLRIPVPAKHRDVSPPRSANTGVGAKPFRTPPRPFPKRATTQSRNNIPKKQSRGIPNVVSPAVGSASAGVSVKQFRIPPRPFPKKVSTQLRNHVPEKHRVVSPPRSASVGVSAKPVRRPPRPFPKRATTQSRNSIPAKQSHGIPGVLPPELLESGARPYKTPPRPFPTLSKNVLAAKKSNKIPGVVSPPWSENLKSNTKSYRTPGLFSRLSTPVNNPIPEKPEESRAKPFITPPPPVAKTMSTPSRNAVPEEFALLPPRSGNMKSSSTQDRALAKRLPMLRPPDTYFYNPEMRMKKTMLEQNPLNNRVFPYWHPRESYKIIIDYDKNKIPRYN